MLHRLMQPLYQQKVAGNLKLFEADRSKGVIFRGRDNQPELADNGMKKSSAWESCRIL